MKPEDQARLVESYIASSKFVLDKESILRCAEESSWASDALFGVALSEPSVALQLFARIAESDGSEQMLERVANGPMLQLLMRAEPEVLSQVAEAATKSHALREVLSCVWGDNELPESTWAVIHEHSSK